jgi:hypothetical protein
MVSSDLTGAKRSGVQFLERVRQVRRLGEPALVLARLVGLLPRSGV